MQQTSSSLTNLTQIRRKFVIAAAAGIVGGICIDSELAFTSLRAAHLGLIDLYRQVSALVLGALPAPVDPVLLGLSVHFAVSIGWAIGFVWLAASNAALTRRPWISGIAFGVLVYIGMQCILLGINQYHTSPPGEFVNALIAHTFFFGVPIALVTAVMIPQSSR